MIAKWGERFTDLYQRLMPSAFVFALVLTLAMSVLSFFWVDASPLTIIQSWYKGFWSLLEFGMQIVLIIITGFSIALSPTIKKAIDMVASYVRTPTQVYFFVVLIGVLLSMISFGWVVITSIIARELAMRVKGVNYPFLIACVYFSMGSWVNGFSSSIPLLLNTPHNYLVDAGILSTTIPTELTLGSSLNIAMIAVFVIVAPLMLLLMRPKSSKGVELNDLQDSAQQKIEISIEDEAAQLNLPFKSFSDRLNNSFMLQGVIVLMGLTYILYHFYTRGFDLNFNIMIFIFLIAGLLLHRTPAKFAISMKRSSSNVSGILFQYPFYAGIMGIMLYTGLGEAIAKALTAVATQGNYAFLAYATGGLVNFAIPSAGGEFAVVGPSILETVKELSAGLSQAESTAMISRASLSIAYGESLSNLLQPFFLLLVLPVMCTGIKLQARDIMGYLVLPFLIFFMLQAAMVSWWPY